MILERGMEGWKVYVCGRGSFGERVDSVIGIYQRARYRIAFVGDDEDRVRTEGRRWCLDIGELLVVCIYTVVYLSGELRCVESNQLYKFNQECSWNFNCLVCYFSIMENFGDG
jgi:hypothetical protein